MIFERYFENNSTDKEMYCCDVIDYQCLDNKFFDMWYTTWTYEIGIRSGDKIGMLIENNKHIMPLVLSLEKVLCEIHFLNKTVGGAFFDSNLLNCNYIITDQSMDNKSGKLVCELNFYDIVLKIYLIQEHNQSELLEKQYVYYTSGSTGNPKAFVKNEYAIYQEGITIIKELGIECTDRILSIVPCNHVFGQSVACIAAALAGAKVTYMNAMSSIKNIIGCIKNGRYNYVIAPMFYYDLLCEFKNELDNNIIYVSGGTALSEKIRNSQLQVVNFYGSTETGVVAINRGDKSKHYAGRLVAGVEVDYTDKVETCNVEEVYSLKIKTPYMAKTFGILGERITEIKGYIQTSDYGVVIGNDLFVHGRVDNIININGLKVSTTEIEQEILKNKLVKEVKVVRERLNERDYAHAYVVEKVKGTLTTNDLVEFCINNMEHYKIPKKIEIVEALQCSGLGKVIMNQEKMRSM